MRTNPSSMSDLAISHQLRIVFFPERELSGHKMGDRISLLAFPRLEMRVHGFLKLILLSLAELFLKFLSLSRGTRMGSSVDRCVPWHRQSSNRRVS